MPLYIGDHMRECAQLTATEEGVYVRLVMAMWGAGGHLPDDDGRLAAVARITSQEWRKVRPVVAAMCIVANGQWSHRRVLRELVRAAKLYQQKVAASALGVAARRRSVDRTVDRSVNHPVDRSVDRSVNRPVDRMVDRMVNPTTTTTTDTTKALGDEGGGGGAVAGAVGVLP